MAKIYLANEHYICNNSNVTIYGSGGTETVALLDGVYNVTIYNTIESITLPKPKSSYVITKAFSGEEVYLDDKLVCKTSTIDVKILFSGVDLRAYTNGVVNQGSLGACASFATTTMLEILMYKKTGRDIRYSTLFTYYNARKMDNPHNIQDTGSQIYRCLQSMRDYGSCLDNAYPYDSSKVNDLPSYNAYESGRENRLVTKFQRIFNSSAIQESNFVKSVLDNGLALAFAIPFTQEFHKLLGFRELEDINYTGENALQSAHAMCVVGYDDTLNGGSFIIENSWGKEFADNGFFPITYEVFNRIAYDIYYIED